MIQQPVQITFRDIPPSPGVETFIKQKIDKLDQFFNPIIIWQVTIEQTRKKQHQGKLYNVHFHVDVPDKRINSMHNADENLYLAIQRGLDNIWEQLDEYQDKLKGHVKTHTERLNGEIIRLFTDESFGFIKDTLGDEYYFSMAAMHNSNFSKLKVGTKVHFIPWIGNEGQQAHRVTVIMEKH